MKHLVKIEMLAFFFSLISCEKNDIKATVPVENRVHRLSITVGDQTITAILYDNPTAKDFISRLPFTVDMSDYGNSEKIFTLSPELTTNGSSSEMKPKAGDITLFVPWGNIAIFYRDGTSSGSLIPIGRIERGLNALSVSGTIRSVKFELTNVESSKMKI